MDNIVAKGESLFAEGRIDEAEQFFLSVAENDTNSKEAYNNLGVIAIQKNNAKSAIEYFTKSLEIDPFYKDAIVNYAELLSSLDQLHIAGPLLEKIADKYPDDEEITNLLEYVFASNQVRHKIAVICPRGLESFIGNIVDFLKIEYEVRVCYSTNVQEVDSTIMWSDIVWLEWANELAMALTNHPKNILKDKQVICRLHRYEVFTDYLDKIKWENISDLIFVAEHIKKTAIKRIPSLPQLVQNIHIVPNGINPNKLRFKQKDKGYNIAYLGYINDRKGPILLLHSFRELVQSDNRYQLFIGGKFEYAYIQLYFDQMIKEMGLEENVQFDGWIENQNIYTWLDDKQYIVCTSIHEGHPVGIMEAMICGLKPLIHNYVGARESYPDKYIWNTIPEFVQMVNENNYDSTEYRKFIETNYSLELQLQRINKILSGNYEKSTTIPRSVDKKPAKLEVYT
ncbi:MAG: glycosyltransferase [Maribacter sp.]|nr:glycosyltransferase [Maribacter sp.]